MLAQVVAIESGTQFVDGEERIGIRFADADNGFSRIRIRRGVIDTTHSLKLDDEFSLDILPAREKSDESPILELGKGKANARAAAGRHES